MFGKLPIYNVHTWQTGDSVIHYISDIPKTKDHFQHCNEVKLDQNLLL